MKKVYFVMPSLPAYREAFFERLSSLCTDPQLRILYGQNTGFKVVKQFQGGTIEKRSFPVKEKKLFGLNVITMPGLYRYFKSDKPDAAIFLFNTGIISFWRVFIHCVIFRIPTAIWATGYVRPDLKPLQKLFRSFVNDTFLRLADFHICYGTGYRDRLVKMGIDANRVFVAQNTIDIEKIVEENRSQVRTAENGKAPAFLYVGAVTPAKKLDVAFRAFKRLKEEGLQFTFAVVGEGSAKTNLSAMACELGLDGEISVKGALYGKELAGHFLNADAFVLPGPGGLAVNEAMAYGLPVISTAGDGTVTDLVHEGVNGYLLKGTNREEEIAAACRRFIGLSPSQREAMGKESISIICRVASLRNMVSQFQACIRRMTK
jgi:glycosyltransferase involved in cell wall biosynthesis